MNVLKYVIYLLFIDDFLPENKVVLFRKRSLGFSFREISLIAPLLSLTSHRFVEILNLLESWFPYL